MKTKFCYQCNTEKNIDDFNMDYRAKDKHQSKCRKCEKRYWQEHREQYRKNGRRNMSKRRKTKEFKAYMKKYNREYSKKRKKEDLNYRLLNYLRNRIRTAMLYCNKSLPTKKLIGCSIQLFRKHLEKQFKEGMNWNNYGRKGWHIDHILPCCSFDLSKEEEQRKCFHYSNLQPLWAIENMQKGGRI